jgi:hypothetical protein
MIRRSLLVCLLCSSLATSACGSPPEKEMQQAQGAIDAARAAGADVYAHDELVGAQDALKRAHEAVAERDYRLALNDALDSRERATAAAKEAADQKAAARTEADRALRSADALLAAAREKLAAAEQARVPPRTLRPARKELATAAQTVQEARTAFDRADYRAVTRTLSAERERLQKLAKDLQDGIAAANRRRR